MEKEQVIKDLKNVRLIFGNGFDLFCGLKTRYEDFFNFTPSYVEQIGRWVDTYENISRAKNYLDGTIENHEQFKAFEILDSNITIWDIYFYLMSRTRTNLKWCDIEEVMKCSFMNEIGKFNWENVRIILWNFIKKCSVPPNKLNEEYVCACYCKYAFKGVFNNKQFYEFLLKELKRFEKRFGDYIKKQMNYPFYKTNALITICKFINHPSDYFGSLSSIETFNYSTLDISGEIFSNINGKYSKPIFGIDSSNISAENDEYMFTKTYRRMELQFDSNLIKKEFAFENLIIFGHSLNEQDYNYFFPLFNRLNITDSSFEGKIVFAYYVYDEDKRNEIKNELIINIAKMFERYEKYLKLRNENRLLDILQSNNNVILYEIDNRDINLPFEYLKQ